MASKRVLVTGGLGYIGSHAVVALHEAGFKPIIIDNLSGSSGDALGRLESVIGESIDCIIADLRDTDALEKSIDRFRPDAVMHFAALKSVSESVRRPLEYYANNVGAMLSLLLAMERTEVKKLIFSSSAAVYGSVDEAAHEDMQLGEPANPYAGTKIQCERILQDLLASNPDWGVTVLRYFNVAGAHRSGSIGEYADTLSGNLMTRILRAANGEREHISVYGSDYSTSDGTCVRDFIHVTDLVKGHIAALRQLQTGLSVYNLGTGQGTSVLQLLDAFEGVTGQKVARQFVGRRAGDLACVIANPLKASRKLGWKAELGIEDMCRDAWNHHTTLSGQARSAVV